MMTRSIVTSILLICLCPLAYGQNINAIFEKETPVTWLGLDFTGALFIGDHDKFQNDTVVYDLMRRLNVLMIDEQSKYSISKTFLKTTVINATEVTTRKNNRLQAPSITSDDSDEFLHLTEEKIREIVEHYDFEGKEGIGLMYNIESFNKLNEKGALWITFIHLPTKKVLLTKQLFGRPMGFGLRNYWAGCIHGVMNKIRYSEFKSWKKKYYHP